MNSSLAAGLRNGVGVVYFVQLTVVIFLFINTASVEVAQTFSVHGTARVAEGSSAWIHLENSDLSSGRLRDVASVNVSSDSPIERQTANTSIGPIDVIEVQNVQDNHAVRFEREVTWGDPLSSSIGIATVSPRSMASFWTGTSEYREFNSVVSGYEDEGVRWQRRPAETGSRLHVAVEGGTVQALMDNDVYLMVTDEAGAPLPRARVVLLRRSLDGETQVELRTNRLGVAKSSVRPRHTEDWTVTVSEAQGSDGVTPARVWQARVVPARDGVIIRPRRTPFVTDATVPIEITLQGTRGTAFAMTRCTDQTYEYTIGGLPGGDSVAELDVPTAVVDEPRICRVQVSTATGYRNVPRSLTAYVSHDQRSTSISAIAMEMMSASASALEPSSMPDVDRGAWAERLSEATEREVEQLARLLLASAPVAHEPLSSLYSSREDIEASAASYRSSRLSALRWLLIAELIAGVALILVFVIPAQREASRAFEALDRDEDEAFGDLGATRGAVIVFWGLMALVMGAVVAGFAFLFSIIRVGAVVLLPARHRGRRGMKIEGSPSAASVSSRDLFGAEFGW